MYDDSKIIIEKEAFNRNTIENRISSLEFNNISKFELFLWDLELFLQLQERLKDKIILKGGAATQFYIPIKNQRTSIDIDMICSCDLKEVEKAIEDIEKSFNGQEELFKFKEYKPKNPKIGLEKLKTYYVKVPTICSENELYGSKGIQEVKIEFLFSQSEYKINKIKSPELFAVETEYTFNILPLEYLFADKLTTIGSKTIGITEDRFDELFKQIYDIITLFESNVEYIIKKIKPVREVYDTVCKEQCKMRDIKYEKEVINQDVLDLIKKIQAIEEDKELITYANNFQSLYLRKSVNRSKQQWAIVGMQLELIYNKLIEKNDLINQYNEIRDLVIEFKFEAITGVERGIKIKEARKKLKSKFETICKDPDTLFRKQLERIIWELAVVAEYSELRKTV